MPDRLKKLIDRAYKISMPAIRDERDYYETTFELIYKEIKELTDKGKKDAKWDSFDKVMHDFGNDFLNDPEPKKPDTIKSRILGKEVMTDSQHRYIIALFTNELNWTAHNAFKFAVKVLPQLRGRLKKRVIEETDIQALYQELNKTEAAKLINILKSVVLRKNVN